MTCTATHAGDRRAFTMLSRKTKSYSGLSALLGGDQPDLAELINRCAKGCRPSFEEVYRRTSRRNYGLLLAMLRDADDAREVLQEVYIRLWTKSASFGASGARAEAWITVLARNAAIDRMRAKRRLPHTEEFEDRHAAARLGHEDRLTLSFCLSQIVEERRNLVISVYVHGSTYEEVAQSSGAPLNTVKSWIRRSMLQLRQCLTEHTTESYENDA